MLTSTPMEICVLGIPYTVALGEVEPGENGCCIPSKRLIGVREGLCEDEEMQVLIHEVLHAVLAGLSYDELYADEHLIQGLAIGLHGVLDSIVPGGRFCA